MSGVRCIAAAGFPGTHTGAVSGPVSGADSGIVSHVDYGADSGLSGMNGKYCIIGWWSRLVLKHRRMRLLLRMFGADNTGSITNEPLEECLNTKQTKMLMQRSYIDMRDVIAFFEGVS